MEFPKEFTHEVADCALVRRASAMIGVPITIEAARRIRGRGHNLRNLVPLVVQSSMVRSICNAWTTTGRFSGPRLPCPFGCRIEGGDKWVHCVNCTAIRGMWREACPSANPVFTDLSLEKVLMICPDMPKEVVCQVALWVDVVGHLSNDMRAQGTSPTRALIDGAEMIKARLRQLAVQSNEASAVISAIRVP